ncbi:MAG: phosphatase [Oscillospiraceae bacterium]|nr:phosphatase [Oscillospiraceae bacterium]
MVDTNKLTELERKAIEARREYQRQWRAANKDKVKANNQRYWQRVAIKKEEHKNG